MKQMQSSPSNSRLHFFYVLPNLVGLILTVLGAFTLGWVGQLAWHDITVWNKDLAIIFFGSRTGENISLGIGMKLLHYFLIGLALLFLGLFTFLLRRNKGKKPDLGHPVKQLDQPKEPSGCSHYFGYLGALPDFDSVPQECLTCKKMLECRNI